MNWKKIVVRSLAALTLLMAIVACGGYFYLKSSAFRQFAMRKIVEEADRATGGRTQIGAFDFQLSTLTAHLYNVVIRGNEPQDTPPLLQLDKLTAGLKIQSALRRRITLSELLIEHPVIYVEVDSKGNSNIPSPSTHQSSSHTSIFDLAVGHLALNRGEVNYEDRKIPLNVDLRGLKTNVIFESLATRYRGTVSYDNGQIQSGQYAPLPHSLNATFNATPSGFALESAMMKIASSSVTLHASATGYRNPLVTGDYALRIHTQDFAGFSPQLKPDGDVSLSGTIRYQSRNNQAPLRSVVLDGQMLSESLSAAASGTRLDLRNLRGRYQLSNGSLQATGIAADVLNGQVSANVEVRNLDATPSSRVRATLHSISLPAAQRAAPRRGLNRVTIAGTLDGTVEAFWTGSISNLQCRTDLSVRGPAASPHSANTVPVNGVIHASYDGPKNLLSLHQTMLRIPSTTLTADGQISQHSKLQIHATSSDLHQLTMLVSDLRAPALTPPLVSGSATLDATVNGSVQRPNVSAQLSAQDLQVQGSTWKTAELSLQASPSQIEVSKGNLISAQRGAVSFGGRVGLRDWSYISSDPLQAKLSVQQVAVGDLLRLANLQYPVSGDLSANISVNGSQLNPAGSGSLQIAKAHVYGEPLQALAATFSAANGTVVSKLNVTMDAGSATTSLSFTPETKAYKLNVDAPAIILQKLRAVQAKNLAVNGTLKLSASGQGTLDDPQLSATLQSPQLDIHQKPITGMNLELRVANRQADFTLGSQVAQASVRSRGHVNLTGDWETDASIDTTSIPLDVLLATYASGVPEGFQGQTEFHATLKGPLKDKTRLEAHLTVPVLTASYQSLQIGSAGPIRADYSHSVFTLQPSEIRGTGTSLRIQGSIPIDGTGTPTLTAQGSIDARILRIVSPEVRSAGTVALNIHTSGSVGSPQLQGQVRLQNISLITPDIPLGVENLNGTLDLGNETVQISNLTGTVGGGALSAGGAIRYRPNLRFDIALQGKSIRLRYPDGLRSVLDSSLTWTGTPQDSTLAGRVLVDSLSFTQDFDLATFGDQFSNAAAPAEPGFADTINLQISVQSTGNLNAAASQVSLEGSADLRVGGTAGNPVITGRTDLSGGELFYRNVRYQLQRGLITFDDPNETKPVLNVSVTTTVEQYNLTLNLRGPFDQLTTSYVSDPPLATADIINLIARGKTSSELAGSSQSTDSILASQAASQLSSSVQKLAGISSLQIDPLLGGNNQNPSARLALQQRISKNFLFTFSTDVTQPGQEIVQGDYQINKRWSVSVERDQVGGVSVDGRFHTRF